MNLLVSGLRLQRGLIPTIVIMVLLAFIPIAGVPREWLLYLFLFFVYLAMANMWNLLAGYSGLVSLCPAAFVGLAGYTLAMLGWIGTPYYFGILAGGIAAALFAVLISYPVFRLKGIYFIIGTLVVPVILKFVFLLWRPVGGSAVGGGAGYTVKGVGDVSQAQIYWLALAVGIASTLVLRYVLRSRVGLGLAAIRDNDNTASSCGVNVFKLKLWSFVISAFLTGLAGAIFYVFQGYIEPDSAFGLQWLITIMLATVIGGKGTQEGPIIGMAIYIFLYFLLARYNEISMIIQGVILVGIMLLAPQGIVGTIRGSRIYRTLFQPAGPDESTENTL